MNNSRKNPRQAFETKNTIETVISVNGRGAGFLAVPEFKEDIEIAPGLLNTALNRDKVLAVIKKDGKKVEARIIKIIERAKTHFVGTIEKKNNNYAFLKPDDRKVYIDFFIAPPNLQNAKDGDKVLVKMLAWTDSHKNPEAVVKEVIGRKGENDVEMRSIVLSRGLETTFPSEVEKEAEKIKNIFKIKDELKNRKDFRNTTTFTIDPEDAKDFDDAVSLKKLENGNYEIGVHIADVSFFVKDKTILDKEASKRGFSIYLVDRTIPMLPEILSNDLCSLNPHEDKLAFSAVFEITKDGDIKKKWFGRTVINSDKRFSYEEAQGVLDKKSGQYFEELDVLNQIAHALRKTKFAKGAIAFETDEVKFKLDKDGKPISVFKKERLDTHKLVEDFMLLANKEVAEFVYNKIQKSGGKGVFIYRIHDLPDEEKMQELSLFLRALGYEFNLSDKPVSPKDINLILQKIEGRNEEDLIRTATIRSMAKAIYSVKNKGHFGLAFKYYTHFTSPIRRYPDLLVHRLLFKFLSGFSIQSQEFGHYERMAMDASEKELDVASAERESIKYKQVEYMQDKVGNMYDGIISGVTDWGIYVEEVESKSEGMIRLSSLSDDFYSLNRRTYSMVGQKTGKKLSLGDKVKIKVLGANLENKTIDYALV